MPKNGSETLVAMQIEDGFRVYAPANPQETFEVSGTQAAPNCSCPEFQNSSQDNDFRCPHIQAVECQLPQEAKEGNGHGLEGFPPVLSHSEPQMVVKRSVSPDGHIDSFSVEFTLPMEGMTSGQIKERAAKTVALQEEIVGHFLEECGRGGKEPRNSGGNGQGNNRRRNGNGIGNHRDQDEDGAVPARMIDVRGMNTRVGWKLFITVQANRQSLKLFGTRKELGDFITDAGYPELAREVNAGVQLDIPCRVTIRPSEDGRFQNVEQVFPESSGVGAGRGR